MASVDRGENSEEESEEGGGEHRGHTQIRAHTPWASAWPPATLSLPPPLSTAAGRKRGGTPLIILLNGRCSSSGDRRGHTELAVSTQRGLTRTISRVHYHLRFRAPHSFCGVSPSTTLQNGTAKCKEKQQKRERSTPSLTTCHVYAETPSYSSMRVLGGNSGGSSRSVKVAPRVNI